MCHKRAVVLPKSKHHEEYGGQLPGASPTAFGSPIPSGASARGRTQDFQVSVFLRRVHVSSELFWHHVCLYPDRQRFK